MLRIGGSSELFEGSSVLKLMEGNAMHFEWRVAASIERSFHASNLIDDED